MAETGNFKYLNGRFSLFNHPSAVKLKNGVFVALGSLALWHASLISRGETSIEAHINKAEIKRLAAKNKVYINPYNLGRRKNWHLFLGMMRGRKWRHVLLPSRHKPPNNGLTWHTLQSDTESEHGSSDEGDP